MESIIANAAMQLPVFLFAIVSHEWGHAWMAKVHGDNTAELQGRLSLNPLVHIDLMGTVFFPLAPLGHRPSRLWLGQAGSRQWAQFARPSAKYFLDQLRRPRHELAARNHLRPGDGHHN